MNTQEILISELNKLLKGGSAHASFDHAIKGLSLKTIGQKVDKLPYTIWQLVEHIRITQWDMLEFSKSAKHVSPKWPEDYWPKEAAPADEAAWEKSLQQIKDDLADFIHLLKDADLYTNLAHGDGQNILREALQIADHNSYHTAEIIMVRRLLGDWK
ncbi:MAG: DinB family protein [Bacteroidetes bacterium]|nr:DinB family protein [Bacteroidota bacterium]